MKGIKEDTEMAIVSTIYRCAKCGSKNVVPYSADGQPMKDPLIDILKNKSAAEFRCLDCGAVMDHPMEDVEKADLDAEELDGQGASISGALNK